MKLNSAISFFKTNVAALAFNDRSAPVVRDLQGQI